MNVEITNWQPTIHADRFDLRPLRYSDVGPLEMHMGDRRVAEMTRTFPHPLPPAAIDAYIGRSLAEDRNEDIWVMDASGHGMGGVLGCIGLERMDRGQCEIAFWIVPGLWGTGLATEAVNALIQANPHDCETVFAAVFQDNPASAKLLSNLGFNYLGDAEYHSVARDTLVPTWTYSKRLKE